MCDAARLTVLENISCTFVWLAPASPTAGRILLSVTYSSWRVLTTVETETCNHCIAILTYTTVAWKSVQYARYGFQRDSGLSTRYSLWLCNINLLLFSCEDCQFYLHLEVLKHRLIGCLWFEYLFFVDICPRPVSTFHLYCHR